MEKKIIRIEKIKIKLGGKKIMEDERIQVREGESIEMVGRNGQGK